MRVIEHSQLRHRTFERSVVTIGNFDGVHRGHEALLGRVAARAREQDAASVVYTFYPHPLKILNPSFCPPLLTGFDERVALIARQGVDGLVWARFDRDYADQDPADFARETLAERLGAVELWVGPDFGFGRGRSGSVDLLRRVGEERGFSVRVLDAYRSQGEVVSSTRIRTAVAAGDFETAERLLGRPYALHGPVVHGAGRGRGLGFPTANILPREECMPPPGVYAAWAESADRRWPAAVNVGPNPTFGEEELSVEAYLLEFTGDLYGEELTLRFVAPVRGEIAFRSPIDLSQQITEDVETVRRLLREHAQRPTVDGSA